MKRAIWMTLLLALALSACDKKKEEQAPPAEKKAESSKLTDDKLDKADVPVSAEFELEARSQINEKNVKEQLDALEKEISADP